MTASANVGAHFDSERNAGYRDLIAKDYSKAEKHYIKALDESAREQPAPYKVALTKSEYGDVLLHLERPGDAAQAYRQAISIAEAWIATARQTESFGFDRDLSILKGKLAVLEGKAQKNTSSTEEHKAPSKPANEVERQLSSGVKLIRQRKFVDAISILQKAVVACQSQISDKANSSPNWQSHRLLLKCLDQLALACGEAGDLKQAKAVLLNSYNLKRKIYWQGYPTLLKTSTQLGVLQARLNERAEAKLLLATTLEYPSRVTLKDLQDAHYHLMCIFEQEGNNNEARRHFDEYVKLALPDSMPIRIMRERLSALASQLTVPAPILSHICAERANKLLAGMTKRDRKTEYSTQLLRADALLRARKWKPALEVLLPLQATATDNTLDQATCNQLLAYAQYQLGEIDAASKTVRKALRLHESLPIPFRSEAGYEATIGYAIQVAASQSDARHLEQLLDELATKDSQHLPGLRKLTTEAYATLAKKESVLNKHTEASKHYATAYKQWTVLPLSVRAPLGVFMGDIGLELHEPQKALTCYNEVTLVEDALPRHISVSALQRRIDAAKLQAKQKSLPLVGPK